MDDIIDGEYPSLAEGVGIGPKRDPLPLPLPLPLASGAGCSSDKKRTTEIGLSCPARGSVWRGLDGLIFVVNGPARAELPGMIWVDGVSYHPVGNSSMMYWRSLRRWYEWFTENGQ